MFIRKNLKTQEKLKELEIICILFTSISVFSDIAKFADFRRKNADVSGTQGVCHVNYIFIYFVGLLELRYNCAKFHHCRICVTDFREVGLFAPPFPIRKQSRKDSS